MGVGKGSAVKRENRLSQGGFDWDYDLVVWDKIELRYVIEYW